ncbi:MAG: 5-oxoprolinase subunit PxpB [Rhodocyclaceae bacterium]|nr:5-oxoprolinase subunit PxpB [Rhodocyclaceae bacterium]
MKIVELGDAALTLEFGNRIDPVLHARVIAARDALPRLPGITDVVPTYRSLTVHFDPRRLAAEELSRHLLAAANAPQQSALAGCNAPNGVRRWRIPICCDGDCGPDLAAVATATGRAPEEVVAVLCGQPWRVFLIGFLPGFPYMGELPEWLRLPRLTTPRTAVPERSVAIAGAQCAIYPWQSPGGWHLLGRTPARLFNANDSDQPALLAPGDAVSFVAIERSEYDRLELAITSGEFSSRNFSV